MSKLLALVTLIIFGGMYPAIGQDNLTVIRQVGNENSSYIEQTGSGLETHLWQSDFSNEANLQSVGNNIQTFVEQTGDENIINSRIENDITTTKSAFAYQIGNYNEIKLDFRSGNENPTPDEVILKQHGDGNFADVELSNYDVPGIKIEQTGGAKVVVRNSVFNYP